MVRTTEVTAKTTNLTGAAKEALSNKKPASGTISPFHKTERVSLKANTSSIKPNKNNAIAVALKNYKKDATPTTKLAIISIRDLFQYMKKGKKHEMEGENYKLLLNCDSYQRFYYKSDIQFISGIAASLILKECINGEFHLSLRNGLLYILDGQQRTMTIIGFVTNDIVFDYKKLDKDCYTKEQLEILEKLDGLTLDEICKIKGYENLKEEILDLEISMKIHTNITREEEVIIYKRTNSHTKKVSPLEILRADYCEHPAYKAAEKIADEYLEIVKYAGKKDTGIHIGYALELMAMAYLKNDIFVETLSLQNMKNVKNMLDDMLEKAKISSNEENYDEEMLNKIAELQYKKVCQVLEYIKENNLISALENATFSEKASTASKKFNIRVLFLYILRNKEHKLIKENLFAEAIYNLYRNKDFKASHEELVNNGTGKVGNAVLIESVWEEFFDKISEGKYFEQLKNSPKTQIKPNVRFSYNRANTTNLICSHQSKNSKSPRKSK